MTIPPIPRGLAEESRELLEKAGVQIVYYDALTPGEQDYTAILTKLKSASPDLLFFTGYYPETGMLLRQKKEMGWTVPMMGGDAANHQDLVKIAGKDAAAGYFFISPPLPQDIDTPEAQQFLKGLQGEVPGFARVRVGRCGRRCLQGAGSGLCRRQGRVRRYCRMAQAAEEPARSDGFPRL